MKYLVELVFGIGFFGIAAIALTFFLRFLLLTWAVRIIGGVIQGILRFVMRLCHALVFIFGPALLGGFIIGIGLGVGETATSNSSTGSAGPMQPVLLAFLGFFVIVAIRAWQWNSRQSRTAPESPEQRSGNAGSPHQGNVADAWARAVKLAPALRDELQDAQAACSALLAVVESGEGEPGDAMIETAELIHGYLAPFVDSVERRMVRAKGSEKRAIVQEMVKFLRGFAQRAQRDMRAAGLDSGEGDSALRVHLAAQLFGK